MIFIITFYEPFKIEKQNLFNFSTVMLFIKQTNLNQNLIMYHEHITIVTTIPIISKLFFYLDVLNDGLKL